MRVYIRLSFLFKYCLQVEIESYSDDVTKNMFLNMHQIGACLSCHAPGAREVTAMANTRNKEPDARERIPSQKGYQNRQRGSMEQIQKIT